MNKLLIALALFAAAAPLPAETPPTAAQPPVSRDAFRQGTLAYKNDNFQGGLDWFKAALHHLPEPPDVDPALMHYNIGIGHYRLNDPEAAAAAFQEALRTPDLNLQSRTYFNLGNATYQRARQSLNEGDVASAFRLFQAASTNFIQTLRISSDDMDAKINYELSLAAQIRIRQIVAMAMERLQQGEQLVGQHRFVEAAQWFQENKPLAEQALTLEPEAKKLFENMTERTTAVAEIIAPTPPPGGAP